MADEDNALTVPARLVLEAEPPSMLDGKVHVGIAVGLRTGDKPSALVIPDVLGIADGSAPVYLAKPLTLELNKIRNYLEKKDPGSKAKLDANPKLGRFLANTDVAINSLYFRNSRDARAAVAADANAGIAESPAVTKLERLLLMQFEINFDASKETAAEKAAGGLIGSLTGDPNLSEMFDITSLSLRVLQCDKGDVEILQKYIDVVSAD